MRQTLTRQCDMSPSGLSLTPKGPERSPVSETACLKGVPCLWNTGSAQSPVIVGHLIIAVTDHHNFAAFAFACVAVGRFVVPMGHVWTVKARSMAGHTRTARHM